MKITAIESLHADGGARSFDFLKVTTDEGLVGWSEYNEGFGGLGVTRGHRAARARSRRQGPARGRGARGADAGAPPGGGGGMVQQAIGAIENALVDIKAKALGVPVYELFGGPIRDTHPPVLVALRLVSRVRAPRAMQIAAAAHPGRRRGARQGGRRRAATPA